MINPSSIDDFWPDEIPLRQKIYEILSKEYVNPEGRVRAQWILRLIKEYGFDSEQIDIEVPAGAGRAAEKSSVFADIVAYRDKSRKEPFIVVETKGPKEVIGIKQAESYSRNLGSDYHVWTNGITTKYFRTAKYIDQSTEIGNIPHWVGDNPIIARLPKTVTLPPFRDEEHLRSVVRACHDRIFFRLGHDPAKAFDELMKLLFLKLFDERETPRYYEFMVLAGEKENETAGRIRSLFQKSIQSRRYSDVFTTRFSQTHPPTLDLDDSTVSYIVKQFQGYSLVNTSATLEGADVKGTVFEQMVGGTFRGELGAYFTPREIVEFMVEMVDPNMDDVVLDPACGSGGFLIMVIKYVLEKIKKNLPNLTDADIYSQIKQFAENDIFGVDINERMARVSKMNMIMHGDGHSGIFHEHGLNIGYVKQIPLQFGDVTKILSNPPFAGRETDPSHLTKFNVSKTKSGNFVQVNKSLPFVELIINLLAEGGVAGLVLPNGIFNSQSHHFKKLRDIIYQKCEVIAIIGLPHWVFFHTGCDVQGALLFIRRTDAPRDDYNVFIDWAENVGYDAAGRKTGKNDLHEILDRYKNKYQNNLFRASVLKSNGRMDPQYYQPGEAAERIREAKESGRAVPFTELVTLVDEVVKRNAENENSVKYIQVGDTDKASGKILSFKEYKVKDLPSRAKYIIHENNLLIPNHRNSIKAKRSVVLVPAEYDGAVCTSRFIVVRPKVPSIYLYYILNLDFVKEAMLKLVSGSSSTEVKFEQLRDLYIPIPPGEDFDLFIDDITVLSEEIHNMEMQLNLKRSDLQNRFETLYTPR
ncbi:MAG: Site-specific DNA-methyltransferase (adenine-specific) [Methanothrix sp.]|jgi:type I restriction enzyme M protein|nr:MAG: Site-specific DNA-methyltransferase (adenine-specific) [Methanothrix sp.]